MDCPRCGADLSRISLGGRESVYCERCRFADVESDHTSESDGEETWDDALQRFRTANPAGGDTTEDGDSGADPPATDGDGGTDATDSDSGAGGAVDGDEGTDATGAATESAVDPSEEAEAEEA